MKKKEKKKQGKRNRAKGLRFESLVRKDLEKQGWIVDKWSNNVDLEENKLIPARRKYNPFKKALSIGTGFPDFVCFKRKIIKKLKYNDKLSRNLQILKEWVDEMMVYNVIGVEVKSGKYLDAEEKEKCRWLLDNQIFSTILIAYKSKQRGKIEYIDFEDYYAKRNI